MSYAHQMKIVHRDLKPQNILLNDDFRAKVCDFGIAVEKRTDNLTSICHEFVGTVCYMAPELLVYELTTKYGYCSDVYSFGIILFELIYEEEPYEKGYSFAKKKKVISGEQRPSSKKKISSEYDGLVEIMENSWDSDLEKRPSFKDIF